MYDRFIPTYCAQRDTTFVSFSNWSRGILLFLNIWVFQQMGDSWSWVEQNSTDTKSNLQAMSQLPLLVPLLKASPYGNPKRFRCCLYSTTIPFIYPSNNQYMLTEVGFGWPITSLLDPFDILLASVRAYVYVSSYRGHCCHQVVERKPGGIWTMITSSNVVDEPKNGYSPPHVSENAVASL